MCYLFKAMLSLKFVTRPFSRDLRVGSQWINFSLLNNFGGKMRYCSKYSLPSEDEKMAEEVTSKFALFIPNIQPTCYPSLRDITLKGIKHWFKNFQFLKAIDDQRYIPARHEILGCDLATAHFIIYRGGKIKFHGQTEWLKLDEDDDMDWLPNKYVENMYVEAVDASGVPIRYDGLQNLSGLSKLKWLSFRGAEFFDDWCLDRVSGGEHMKTLEYLDISDCPNVTERGLVALYRLENLKMLKVHNIAVSKPFELTCLLLEEMHPNLVIEGVTYMQLENPQLNLA